MGHAQKYIKKPRKVSRPSGVLFVPILAVSYTLLSVKTYATLVLRQQQEYQGKHGNHRSDDNDRSRVRCRCLIERARPTLGDDTSKVCHGINLLTSSSAVIQCPHISLGVFRTGYFARGFRTRGTLPTLARFLGSAASLSTSTVSCSGCAGFGAASCRKRVRFLHLL